MMDLQLFRKKLQKNRSIWIISVAGCLILVAAVVCCVLLRPRADKPDTFFLYMQDADAYYAQDEVAAAFRVLDKARQKAISSTNWLSLLKRCIAWNNFDVAVDYASDAASLFPGNSTISAVCCYIGIRAGDYDLALRYARPLTDDSGAVMNAYLQSKKLPPLSRDPAILAAAARVGSIPVLSENAAILYAMQGSLDKALSLSPNLYEVYTNFLDAPATDSYEFLRDFNPLFWLLLRYDAGDPAQVFRVAKLIVLTEISLGIKPVPELLSIQADSAFVNGDYNAAFDAWRQLSLLYPHYRPEIWYNLAHMADTGKNRLTFLDELLTAFPYYPPALRMLTCEAIRYETQKKDDPIETALSNAGMKSIVMIERENDWCVDRASAERYFEQMRDYFKSVNMTPSAECALEQSRFDWAFLPPERARIDIWRLLETYPYSECVNQYAVWLFLSGATIENARIVLHNWESEHEPTAWSILANAFLLACDGDLGEAEIGFRSVSATYGSTWQLFANISVMEEYAKNWTATIDLLTLALSHTDNPIIQSRLHYETGRVLIACRNYQGARTALHYALDLDPGNYPAKVLLMSIE